MVGHLPRRRLVRDAAEGHQQRQHGADHGPQIDEEGLHHVALRLLRVVEHVGHQSTEGLHRHVEREVHEEQDEGPHDQRREGQQGGAVGHQRQGDGRDDGAAQNVGDAPPQAGPRAVGEEADERLDDHAGDGRRKPEVAQVAHVGSERLENTRRIGVLQRVADLHTEESEAQIPDLPERQFRFFHNSGQWSLGYTNFNKMFQSAKARRRTVVFLRMNGRFFPTSRCPRLTFPKKTLPL